MNANRPYRVIISGGGTGGHVFPAIAIAKGLEAVLPEVDILFVGAKGKLEMEKVPEAGYPIKGLWISGFQRKLSVRNLSFPFKLLSSLWKSRQIIRQFKPDIAIGVGGYASGPLLYVAARKGLPIVLQEQNSFPGITNRLLANKADAICVAYEGLERFFPKETIRITGNPVRQQIAQMDMTHQAGAAAFDLNPGQPIVLSVGGSLGARTINQSLAGQLDQLLANGVQLIWQTGKVYYEELAQWQARYPNQLRIVPFISHMEAAYAAADVIISRAGAIAVSELCLLGKPVVLVPSPNVAEDHQRKNAEALVRQGAAKMVLDKDAAEQLVPTVVALLGHAEEQAELGKAILAHAKPEATTAIVSAIVDLLQQRSV